MQIWEPAVFNHKPFIIVGVLLGLLIVGVLLWCGFGYLKWRKLQSTVDSYSNL
jgi:hypothetical protein